MQNPIQTFRLSSTYFKKPGVLSEKLKTLMNFDNFYMNIKLQFL